MAYEAARNLVSMITACANDTAHNLVSISPTTVSPSTRTTQFRRD